METTTFRKNDFEHDYIIQCLDMYRTELKTRKEECQITDKYAVQITAFMMGEVAAQLKARPQQIFAPSATIEQALKQLIRDAGTDEVKGILEMIIAGKL